MSERFPLPPLDVARDRYAETAGTDALQRQQTEAERRFPCCWALRTDGHHALCPKAGT